MKKKGGWEGFARKKNITNVKYAFHPPLSDEDNAESECERHLVEAEKYDPKNPEMHVQFANLRLCQQRPEMAVPHCRKAAEIITSLGTNGFLLKEFFNQEILPTHLFLEIFFKFFFPLAR